MTPFRPASEFDEKEFVVLVVSAFAEFIKDGEMSVAERMLKNIARKGEKSLIFIGIIVCYVFKR